MTDEDQKPQDPSRPESTDPAGSVPGDDSAPLDRTVHLSRTPITGVSGAYAAPPPGSPWADPW